MLFRLRCFFAPLRKTAFLNRQIHLKRLLTMCKLQNKAKNKAILRGTPKRFSVLKENCLSFPKPPTCCRVVTRAAGEVWVDISIKSEIIFARYNTLLEFESACCRFRQRLGTVNMKKLRGTLKKLGSAVFTRCSSYVDIFYTLT